MNPELQRAKEQMAMAAKYLGAVEKCQALNRTELQSIATNPMSDIRDATAAQKELARRQK